MSNKKVHSALPLLLTVVVLIGSGYLVFKLGNYLSTKAGVKK